MDLPLPDPGLFAMMAPAHHTRADAAPGRTDDSLMQELAEGSMDALATLVRRHQRLVLEVAGRSLARKDLAADVAQDVFLELRRLAPRYEGRGRLRGYLVTLTFNQCRVMARRAPPPVQPLAVEASEAATPAAHGAHELMERREAGARMDAAVARLSDKLRAVVVLRYVADLPLESVATELGLPLGTVKSRLHAALGQLRTALEEGSHV